MCIPIDFGTFWCDVTWWTLQKFFPHKDTRNTFLKRSQNWMKYESEWNVYDASKIRNIFFHVSALIQISEYLEVSLG